MLSNIPIHLNRAHNFASAVKSRLTDKPHREIDVLVTIWKKAFTCLRENLYALRLMPFFFSTYPELGAQKKVDARPIIKTLEGLTNAVTARYNRRHAPSPPSSHYVLDDALASSRTVCDSNDPSTCTGCKNLSALLLANTQAHVSTLAPHEVNDERSSSATQILTCWCGAVTAAAFYLNGVLRLWNAGQPIEPRLFRRLIDILKRDIERSENEREKGKRSNELWFWKVFVGSYALAVAPVEQKQQLSEWMSGGLVYPNISTSEERKIIQGWFDERIRRWSKLNNITEWEDAKEALSRIVWATTMVEEDKIAKNIWTEAISSG
jgi:hypothetical protein